MFENVLYIFAQLVSLLFAALNLAMLIRAITSWMPGLDGAWLDFVYMITEPVIIPVRAFFDRIGAFKNSPIDFSFMIAYMLLMIVEGAVSAFTEMVLR